MIFERAFTEETVEVCVAFCFPEDVVLASLSLGGVLFSFLAAHLALRRPLLESLRQE